MDYIKKTKVSLQCEFEMTDMGLLHLFLGLETGRIRGRYSYPRGNIYNFFKALICMQSEMDSLRKNSTWEFCTPISIATGPNQKLLAHDYAEFANTCLYEKLVGSLIW